MDKKLNLDELYRRPKDKQFTKEEVDFIKKHLNKNDYEIIYAFWKRKSKKKAYIVFAIDTMRNAWRRSLVMNNWEIISRREISKIEFQEQAENYGCQIQRFTVWYYKDIEDLIESDAIYNIETPKEFVEEARKRGYSRKINQLKLNL